MPAPLSACVTYNAGEVGPRCNASAERVLPSFQGSSSCRAQLREVACASLCAVTSSPFALCSSHCDAIHSLCREADADDDASAWCQTTLGIRVADGGSCWQPREAAATRSRVWGPGLAPTAGWSLYAIHIELRDAFGNRVAPQQLHRVQAHLQSSGVPLNIAADGSASYTWYQQHSDSLVVTLDGSKHLPGSPFALSVLPKSRCLSGPPAIAKEPLCPDFQGRQSCCGSSSSSLLAYAERPQHSAQCRAAWRSVLCVAACHPRQQSLLTKSPTVATELALVVSPDVCRHLRDACALADAHCTGAVIPWGGQRILRLHVSGAAPVWQDPPSARHSLLRWAHDRLVAGGVARVSLRLRDAAGIELDTAPHQLKLFCRHLPSGQLFAIDALSLVTRQPLTLAGAYLLRGFLNGEEVGVTEAPALLWVDAGPPVVPVVAPPGFCPDRYGNEPLSGCSSLVGIALCSATRVSGRGLSVVSSTGAFSVVSSDALQNPVLDTGFVFRVLVNNRSVAVAPGGGLVTYSVPSSVDAAVIAVSCNGVALPGSPWTAVRPAPSWKQQQRELELQQHRADPAPPVTAVAASFANLGNALQIVFDSGTAVPPCGPLLTAVAEVASCYWQNASVAVYVLSNRATLLSGASVTVSGGVLPAGSPNSQPSAPSTLTIVAAAAPVVPSVSISAPSRARVQLELDATGSTLLGGRPAVNWTWTVSSGAPAALAAAVAAANGPLLRLDSSQLGSVARRFSFAVAATSWLGTAATSPSVEVLWDPTFSAAALDNCRVLGPSLITTTPAASFVLRGTAGTPLPTTAVDYAWYPTVDSPFVSPSINRILADTKNLQYAPPELRAASRPYRLRYSVTYDADAAFAAGSAVSMRVVPSLYPYDEALRWPRSAPLLLDASGFVDDAAQFAWSWSCTRVDFDGVTKSCFQTSFALSNSAKQFIPAGYLHPGVSSFVVSVGGQVGRFSVEAVLGEVPIVDIEGPAFGLQPPQQRLVLRCVAADPFGPCNDDKCTSLRYSWSVSDKTVVLERPNGPNLQLLPNVLVPGQLYVFQLCVASLKGTGCQTLSVRANAPPSSGTCSAVRTPSAASTTVFISCQGWEDAPEQGPLQYFFSGENGLVISAGYSTSNTEPAAIVPVGMTRVFVSVSDALGSATAPFEVPIVVASLPSLPVPPAQTMAQLAAQDQVERALAQCDSVEGYLLLRLPSTVSTQLEVMLACSVKLAGDNNTTPLQWSLLLANATHLLNRTTVATNAAIQKAVDLAALAVSRVPKNDLLPPLLAQIGRSIAARTAPGAGPPERFESGGLVVVGESSLGVPLVHERVTLLPSSAAAFDVPCAPVDFLYLWADRWNPLATAAAMVMCSPYASLQMSQLQSHFGLAASLDPACVETAYCASLVNGSWTREGCVRAGNASCVCDSSAHPVALFYDIVGPIFPGGLPAGPEGFYLGATGIAGLIAVAVVAAAGLLLLIFAAVSRGAAASGAGPMVARFAWSARGAEAARDADLTPSFARQTVSFGDGRYVQRADTEDFTVS